MGFLEVVDRSTRRPEGSCCPLNRRTSRRGVPPRRLNLGDVDLFLRHHCVKRALGNPAIGIGDRGG